MGFIGIGSMGGGHLRSFLGDEDVRVVAVCDVRSEFRQRAQNTVNRHYGDSAACRTRYVTWMTLLSDSDVGLSGIRKMNSLLMTTRPIECSAAPCGARGIYSYREKMFLLEPSLD
jgi:hypothetical protein